MHPEYIDLLRSEIESQSSLDYHSLENLPLLDSFMKETSRLNPVDAGKPYNERGNLYVNLIMTCVVGVRRKALRPYTFSDGGPHVPIGNIVCVPQYSILRDETNYPRATAFDGFRFMSATLPSSNAGSKPTQRTSRFTDVTETYPVWGYGSWAWYVAPSPISAAMPLISMLANAEGCSPGRFYASFIMKMVLVHILVNYDFKLVNEKAPRVWAWRTFRIPYEKAQMLFRERVRNTLSA